MRTTALLCCLMASTLVTDEPKQPTSEDLIGEDLSGWEGSVADWRVEEGVLIGTADGSLKQNRFIWSKTEPVRNFELTVDVNVSPGGNSGIQYRSTLAPELSEFAMRGYQCDVVAARPDYNGMLYEEKGRRILAHAGEKVVVAADGQPWVIGTMPVKTFPPGKWHTYRVRVEGNRHRHWIDDHLVVDVADRDAQGRRLEGRVGVQVHVGPTMTIRYRDMRLERLPDDLLLHEPEVPEGAEKVVPQGGGKPSAKS